MGRSVFDRPAPRIQPIEVAYELTFDEMVALFADRRCRFGSAAEWLTPHELRRIELDQWLYRRHRLNEGT